MAQNKSYIFLYRPHFRDIAVLSHTYKTPAWTRSETCVNIKQTIDAFTINGAWNLGLENERGSITEGKYADFILIDHDLLKAKPSELHNTNVLNTYFEGKCVYKK